MAWMGEKKIKSVRKEEEKCEDNQINWMFHSQNAEQNCLKTW